MSPQKLIGPLSIVAAVIAIAVGTSCLVVRAAVEAAGSEPYCIQVSDGTSDYRPARAWLDLSALTMWAARESSMYMQHHAVLVVGEAAGQRLYHWSYRHYAFEPGVLNGTHAGRGPAIACRPVRDFATARLALFRTSPKDNYIKYVGGETYLIPTTWQARWKGGSSPSLHLAMGAPDFLPLKQNWRDLQPLEREANQVFVTWDPEWVLGLMKPRAPRDNENTVEQGPEFGLAKTRIETHGRDGKDYVGYSYLAYGDGHGINATIIGCGMPTEARPKSCQHRFINKGRHFYFVHRPQDVPDWQKMQQRILELMAGFEVH